jgi:hypothetical protein
MVEIRLRRGNCVRNCAFFLLEADILASWRSFQHPKLLPQEGTHILNYIPGLFISLAIETLSYLRCMDGYHSSIP